MDTLEITVVHRKQEHKIPLPASKSTVADLRQAIEELTYVPADKQKLLVPRSAGIADLNTHQNGDGTPDQRTLSDVGLAAKPDVKLTVLGPSSQELEQLYQAESEMQKRNAPRQYHPSLLRGTKARNTTTAGSTFSPFGSIVAHPSTPPTSPLHGKVIDYLTRLSRDPGILHICQLHQFKIGSLTELLPWEHPGLLGLNENAGQRILLRIRTDDAEGFRDYKTSRRVLVHELAHNKISDHPPEFKIFNSELNAQIEAFEKRKSEGTHALVEGEVYEPETQLSAGAGGSGGQRLGGGPAKGGDAGSLEERRQRVLMATMRRLEREEQEIEQSCGSAANAASKNGQRAPSGS